jgi:hypothetical protein
MRTSAACATGTMCRMRFCRIEGQKQAASPACRAPEIESLVCDSVRRHLTATNAAEPQTGLADRELLERHVARVIVKSQALDVWLIPTCEASAQAEDPDLSNHPADT